MSLFGNIANSTTPLTVADKMAAWSKVSTRSSKKRYLHTSIIWKHYIITYGGSKEGDGYNDAFGDLVVFNINTYEWNRVKFKGFTPPARYAHTACLYNEDQMVVFGGFSGSSTFNATMIMTFDESNLRLVTCENVITGNKSRSDNSRCRHTSNIVKNQMYVFGGLDRDEECSNDLWVFDLESRMWNKPNTTGDIPEARYGHCSATYSNFLYVFGGHNGSPNDFLSDLNMLNLETYRWDRVYTANYPSPRRGMSLVGRNEKLYMFGGCDYNGTSLNDLHVLNLNENTWMKIETKNKTPDVRSRHSAVFYDEGMFIWGGFGNSRQSDIHYIDLRIIEREGDQESHQKYVSQIKDLYTTMNFADIVFVVGDERFSAHKVILSTRCEFFANLFKSNIRDSQGTEIVVDDVSPDSFEEMLEYIYSNNIIINYENALDIFQLSNKWGLKKLETQCEQFLIDHLNLGNYADIANVAAKINAEELMEKAIEFGTLHLDRVKPDKLSKLSPAVLVKTIYKVKEVSQTVCRCRNKRRCKCKKFR